MSDVRSRNLVVTLGVAVVAIATLAAVILIQVTAEPDVDEVDADDTAEITETLVRDDSHVLDDAGPDAPTLVEFLDLECEACGAAYPVVQALREKYDGQLNVVVRYFPLDGHLNARNAAHAAEAAARQGRFEDMYSKMFATQTLWGDQQVDHADTFRGFAEDLGLDLDRYDVDVASEEVAQRVEKDFQDGRRLGVTGTPGFFLEGERLDISSFEQLQLAVEGAVTQAGTS